MKQRKRDDGFRMSDALWQRIEPLLPASKHEVRSSGRWSHKQVVPGLGL
jgi:hypothetical protein